MGAHLQGIFYTIVYVLICNMFIETFEEKRILPKKFLVYGIFILYVIIDYVASVTFDKNIFFKVLVVVNVGTLFMWIRFRQKIIKIFFMVFLFQGMCFVMDYISIIFVAKCFSYITIEKIYDPLMNFLLGILSQMFLTCFVMFIRRYAKKTTETLTPIEWVRFTIFPLFTIIVLIALLTYFEIPQNDTQKNILIYIAFGLLIMNIIVFYLINDILKREKQIREGRLLLEHVKNETVKYRSISENYYQQRKREHEYKNQLALIAALARENKYEEINNYLKKYNDQISKNIDSIDTNNVIVNAILNSKYQEAREKGIIFIIKVNDLSNMKIEDEDIVLILSNLLNNAIEANANCDKAIIKLKFIKEDHQIIISVVNTFSYEPIEIGNRFITTKTEDVEFHGIGIENIKDTVKKYKGSYVIKYDEKSFRFAILIPD